MLMTDEEVARLLGLEAPSPVGGPEAPVDPSGGGRDGGARVVEEANSFVWWRARHAALKLFGEDGAEENPLAALQCTKGQLASTTATSCRRGHGVDERTRCAPK